jgi:hypothetical protein
MVSGASFNSQKDNSARIPEKKFIPDPDPGGKKAPDPRFDRNTAEHKNTF